jgi:hypothetical protein
MEGRDATRSSAARDEFAIRISSIDELFWEFDARRVSERSIAGDARWAMLDEWDRVRQSEPRALVIYAPASDRATTDEKAVSTAIRASLDSASGPLKRVDPLSRQEKIAARLGIAFWFLSIVVSTGRASPRASSSWGGSHSGGPPSASWWRWCPTSSIVGASPSSRTSKSDSSGCDHQPLAAVTVAQP